MMEVAARIDRLEEALSQLAAAQARTEHHVAALAATQQALVAAQERTESRLAALAAAQERTEAQLGTLLSWQKGEDERQRGENLERDVVRGAPVLFAGGDGGPPDQPAVRRWLLARLLPLMQSGASELQPVENPFYADLIWWKGDVAAVVEVSAVVDEDDVERAHQRAQTLRRAGIEVVATVVGCSWASGEDRSLADSYHLAYKVGDEVSDAYIAFRRLPAPAPALDPSP